MNIPRRIWASPLWVHALAYAGVLVVGFLAVLPLYPFTSDEGVVLLQAKELRVDGDWLVDGPPASIDPDQTATVPYFGERSEDAKTFYVRHPLYPYLLAKITDLAGTAGAVAVSTFGAFATAVLSALLARELGSRHERLVLWICGVCTPVFFYAYVVVAHTITAAAAVTAAICALRIIRSGEIRYAIGIALACVVATMLRSEGAFIGLSLVAAVACLWLFKSAVPKRLAIVAVSGGLATVAAVVVDRWWRHSIIGDELPAMPSGIESDSFIEDRLSGLFTTWFSSASAPSSIAIAVTTAFVGVSIAGFAARKRDYIPAFVGWVVAALSYVYVLLSSAAPAISGLFLVVPAVWFSILVMRRSDWWGDLDRKFVSLMIVFATTGVLLTQYSIGGGLEWGGRYFSFLLPLLIPLVIAALTRSVQTFGRIAPATIAAIAVASVLVASLAIERLNESHDVTEAAENDLVQTLRQASAAGFEPYVVSPELLIPQNFWQIVDTTRWLVPDEERLTPVIDRLGAQRIPTIVVMSRDPDSVLPVVHTQYESVSSHVLARTDITVDVLRLRA